MCKWWERVSRRLQKKVVIEDMTLSDQKTIVFYTKNTTNVNTNMYNFESSVYPVNMEACELQEQVSTVSYSVQSLSLW
jgi:hypothetical protein